LTEELVDSETSLVRRIVETHRVQSDNLVELLVIIQFAYNSFFLFCGQAVEDSQVFEQEKQAELLTEVF
jgi:hypothetical protein